MSTSSTPISVNAVPKNSVNLGIAGTRSSPPNLADSLIIEVPSNIIPPVDFDQQLLEIDIDIHRYDKVVDHLLDSNQSSLGGNSMFHNGTTIINLSPNLDPLQQLGPANKKTQSKPITPTPLWDLTNLSLDAT